MTLPASGTIKMSQVSVEIQRTSTATTSLEEATVRTLFGKPTSGSSISMTDGYGKQYRPQLSYTVTSSQQQLALNCSTLSGYVAGITDIYVTINAGVYLYDSTPSPNQGTPSQSAGFRITNVTTGDRVFLTNNGYIQGGGGRGTTFYGTNPGQSLGATNGGTALGLSASGTVPITIYNGGYIGGGGGGGYGSNGGAPGSQSQGGGGGGAGGGWGGSPGSAVFNWNPGGFAGGAGSGGSPGGGYGGPNVFFRLSPKATTFRGASGGGGGGVMPGVQTAAPNPAPSTVGGAGGAANQAGGAGTVNASGGGGGGWGASGGAASTAGGTGGIAVAKAGTWPITWGGPLSTTTVYGTIQ